MNDIDDELRYEPLFLTACKSGDLEAVKELLKHGVDPLCEDEDEWNGFSILQSMVILRYSKQLGMQSQNKTHTQHAKTYL